MTKQAKEVIIGLIFEPQDVDPSNPRKGYTFVPSAVHPDKDEGFLYVYDGTTWQKQGAATTGGGGPPAGANAFFVGGDPGSSPFKSTGVRKYIIDTETESAGADVLDIAVSGACGFESTIKGYSAGGSGDTTFETDIEGLVFAGEATGDIGVNLSFGRTTVPTGVSGPDFGLIMAGQGSGGTITTIEKLTFTGESISTSSSVLNQKRKNCYGGESSTKGYAGGGSDDVGDLQHLENIVFSTENVSIISATFFATVYNNAGAHSSTTDLYWGGGRVPGDTNIIRSMDFATETRTDDSETIAPSRRDAIGVMSTTRGAWGAGYTGAVYSNAIDDYIYLSGTSSTVSTTLGATLSQPAGFQGG